MGNRRYRRLVAGADAYRWIVRHKHTRAVDANGRPELRDCRETLLLRREGAAGRVEVVFRRGPGRLVAEALQPRGTVAQVAATDVERSPTRWSPQVDRASVNLNRPRVVRAIVDELAARGTDFGVSAEVDGWSLLDAVSASRFRW